jgi:endonuclease/exonuclease/phosphatase family metal-dependent hydrolase
MCGVLALAVAACSDRSVTGVVDDAAMLTRGDPSFGIPFASNLTVATANMYFGASVEPILGAPPELIPQRVAEAWAVLEQTDFPARARALAAELAKAKPDIIGLQEAAILRTEEVYDPTSTAETEYLDFLKILLADLEARHVHYVPAVQIITTDVELPKLEGLTDGGDPILSGVRLTDRDVILVRSDVPFADPFTYYYTAFLGPSFDPSIPVPVDVLRGITAVTATVHGREFRFVNTHLESEDAGGLFVIRTLQAQELTQVLAATVPSTMPMVVVGDFNSGPGRSVSEGEVRAYDVMVGSGFLDAWTLQPGPELPGFTCCHAADLSDAIPMFDQRIDMVFLANMTSLGKRAATPIVQAYVFNDQRQDLKKYGVWFSDHGAVVAHLVLPNPQMAHK